MNLKEARFLNFKRSVLIWLLLVIANSALCQDYILRHYNAEKGLPQPFIYSLSEGPRGYLWIGTGDGLAHFNGLAFESFTVDDSIAENFVTCAINSNDKMWFGHKNGQITCYNGKTFKPIALPHPSQSQVTAMVKNNDGTIWVSTYADGLLKVINEKSIKHYTFKDPIDIKCLNRINDNELLIGASSGLWLCRIVNDQVSLERICEIPETTITSIKKNKDGSFLAATEEDGIYRITIGKKTVVSTVITEPALFSGIQDVQIDQQNNLWVATFGNGIVKLSPSQNGTFNNAVYFNKSNGFITDNTKLLYEDREGNLWAGHFGEGLTQIIRKAFTIRNTESNIFSIWLNDRYTWLGTDSGLVKTSQATSKPLLHYKDRGLPADKINSLYSPDGKEIWIGTENNGIFRLDLSTDKIKKHSIADEDLSNSINIITGKDDQVWIGTKKGLCNFNLRNNEAIWYSLHQGGLPHNYVNSIYIDSNNKVWVGTRSSILAYIEHNKVNKIHLNKGNGNFEISAVTQDANARIWAGSLGRGIFILDATDSIANLTTKEGLLSDYCYAVTTSNTYIWIGHQGGLSKVSPGLAITPVVYIDGKTTDYKFNPNAIVKGHDEKLWFGTNNGVVLYNPATENKNPVEPFLIITSVTINDEPFDVREKIVLPPGNHKVRIEYLGVSLKLPEMVTYQYKLEGYEQWSDITKNTSVTYNRLSDGTYKFILKATSADGAVTKIPVIITIEIKHPIWKRWWFYPSAFLLLVLLAFSYIKRREFRFREEKTILERKVHERTSEIQFQKKEIEQQRDFIKTKNHQITASIRYARDIQNAVLPSPESIAKLFPGYFLLYKPKDIVSGDFFWVAEKNSKIVFTVADCTGHGVPGAFMSLLGITLLNEIVNIHGITHPPLIANQLRNRIVESLRQNTPERTMHDGMDISLCTWDPHERTLCFTGANQDILIIRNGVAQKLEADTNSISGDYINTRKYFTSTIININEGDQLYLFSDGFKDQFGGEKDKKFMAKRFYQTLLKNHQLTLEQQKTELDKRLIEWMDNTEQTDDITVLGIKFTF